MMKVRVNGEYKLGEKIIVSVSSDNVNFWVEKNDDLKHVIAHVLSKILGREINEQEVEVEA